MDIRNAILAAADHIERDPDSFNFSKTRIPDTACRTPGCALGWIGFFLGAKPNSGLAVVAGHREMKNISRSIMQIDQMDFYNRMDSTGVSDWRYSADRCAEALRLYADKHHPAAEPAYPNWQAIATGPEKVKDSARDQALDWVRA